MFSTRKRGLSMAIDLDNEGTITNIVRVTPTGEPHPTLGAWDSDQLSAATVLAHNLLDSYGVMLWVSGDETPGALTFVSSKSRPTIPGNWKAT